MPYVYGEGIVIRILDKSSVLLGLDKLDFYPEQMQELEHLMWQPNGQIIVSGPTGSGKTTTLYSMMQKLKSPEKNMVSVEDPVEYVLTGVNQVHVNKRAGLTFETALRGFFRHDPDIIMIGHTPSLETQLLAVEAALTGHLVLSTLHTNDALSVVTRLVEMGVEPYLVAATLLGAVSQRLARKVCRECGEDVEVDTNDPTVRFLGITAWDLKEHKVRRGKGCDSCRHTGYKGRLGIYEILTMTSELRTLIVNGATGVELAEAARAQGFLDMRADAKRKVLDGITSPEEVFRVLQPQW